MSDTPVPPEQTVPLSALAVSKISRELQLRNPDWNRIRMFLAQSGVFVDQGSRLVAPSTFVSLTQPGVTPPAWLLIDEPTGTLRAVTLTRR